MLPILDSSGPGKGACDMAGSHVYRQRVSWNGNLLRAGLCLLVIGMSASCASVSNHLPGNASGSLPGVCSEMKPGGDGWAFRANTLMVKSDPNNNYPQFNGVFPSSSAESYSDCKQINSMWHNVIAGEYALTATDNAAFMTTSDNVCSARPTIRIHRFRGDFQMPQRDIERYGRTYTLEPEKYTDPTYPFYIGSHSASWITTPNAIEKNLLLVKELIAKQCGAAPNEIRISGRFTEMPQWKRRGIDLLNTYKSQEIYRGTYYPHTTPIKIVHDDAEMARSLLALASARQQGIQERILAARKEADERLRQAEWGGVIVGAMLLLPCTNPSAALRPYYCK